MNTSPPQSFNDYLKPGWTISIAGDETGQMAATVSRIEDSRLWLELVRPPAEPPLQKGARARIKYWDDSAIVYCWDVEVTEAADPGPSTVVVTMTEPGITLQRRTQFRLQFPVPLALTVIDASDPDLRGAHISNCQTHDLSVGGLLFESDRPLEAGDKIEITLFLPTSEVSDTHPEGSSQTVNAVGWVVRSRPTAESGEPRWAVAIQFLQLEDRHQLDLLAFLAEQTRGY